MRNQQGRVMTDVVVIGGGVIGLSVAYELAGQGCSVRLLDQGDIGREASWAGAGMLPPGNFSPVARGLETSAEQHLRSLSARHWPTFTNNLSLATKIDNGYRKCGAIEIRIRGNANSLNSEIENWRAEGLRVDATEVPDAREIEPAITPEAIATYRLPEFAQVRNPRHLKALYSACAEMGVEFHPGTPAIGFDRHAEKITGVKTPGGTIHGSLFCLCAGAWSAGLSELAGLSIPVKPVRGQIVLLKTHSLPFQHVLQCGPRYLVPRPDGRILVGATEEHAGFEKRNTASAVQELIRFAMELVPALADATLERCWAGLRPGSPDGLPFLGRVPKTENLFLAAGHFRSGLQMSPGTAVLMRELMLGQEPSIPLKGLECDRTIPANFSKTSPVVESFTECS